MDGFYFWVNRKQLYQYWYETFWIQRALLELFTSGYLGLFALRCLSVFILCFSSTELPLTFNTEIQKSQFLSYRKPHANLVVVIFLDCTRSRLILKSPTKVFLIMSGRLSVVVCQLRCLCGKAKNDENFTIVVPFFFLSF